MQALVDLYLASIFLRESFVKFERRYSFFQKPSYLVIVFASEGSHPASINIHRTTVDGGGRLRNNP